MGEHEIVRQRRGIFIASFGDTVEGTDSALQQQQQENTIHAHLQYILWSFIHRTQNGTAEEKSVLAR